MRGFDPSSSKWFSLLPISFTFPLINELSFLFYNAQFPQKHVFDCVENQKLIRNFETIRCFEDFLKTVLCFEFLNSHGVWFFFGIITELKTFEKVYVYLFFLKKIGEKRTKSKCIHFSNLLPAFWFKKSKRIQIRD